MIEPQPYQLSTLPFAIATRPWSGILHLMLVQWRDAMHEAWHTQPLTLAVMVFDVISSGLSPLVRQLKQLYYVVICRWKTAWVSWRERAAAIDKRLRSHAGLQLRLENSFFGFTAWLSISTSSAYDVQNWNWKESWVQHFRC